MGRSERLIWALLLAGLPAAAQPRPQLVWEGEVDGVSLLSVRGNRIGIEDREGLPVQRQRHRFYDRLPDSRQEVRLQVREGRGRVRIIQQPRLDNDYTLVVSIEDRQGGSSRYVLEFYWDTNRGGFFPPLPQRRSTLDPGERLVWSGRVDDEVVVSCGGGECRAETVRGAAAVRERFRFSRPMPERDVTVSLEDAEGRGEVRLIQQPREENGYTARVRIRDNQGGAGDYSFSLAWTRPFRNEPDSFARRSLTWSGRVDGRARVVVQGETASVEVVSGAPVSGENARFSRPLPQREAHAGVRKLRGRGRVQLVEHPSARNGYRLVFEIEDRDGGADNYEVEVSW